jgi:hypothetical protein
MYRPIDRFAHVVKTHERAFAPLEVAAIAQTVTEALDAFEAEVARPSGLTYRCPECNILTDADDAFCRWCDARNPEMLEAITWAELRLKEQGWPEDVHS